MAWLTGVFLKIQPISFGGNQSQSILRRIKSAYSRIKYLEQVRKERHELKSLSDDQLQDIGIHRADADHESARSYYDVPEDRD